VPIYGEDWLDQRGQAVEEAKASVPHLQTYRKGYGERIPDWNMLERSLYGFDVSRQMVRIASMNLVLHGLQEANVKRANTLSDLGGLTDEDLRREYRVILSNPPFAGVLPRESIRKDLPTRSKKSELLFLGVMLRSLAPGGRCAVVVPEGLLFQSSSSYRELRKMLVDDFDLQAVISLPAGVFKPYAGVKTSVLVFRRPAHSNVPRSEHVWFYDVLADGYDPDRISGGGRVETPDRNDIPDLLYQWKTYAASHFRQPPGVKARTVLSPDDPEACCWWATKEFVAANDYTLAASQYRPQREAPMTHEDTAELIQDLLRIERDIQRGLEELLAEVRSVQASVPVEAVSA
jgi:type I restriction enzyme M protein